MQGWIEGDLVYLLPVATNGEDIEKQETIWREDILELYYELENGEQNYMEFAYNDFPDAIDLNEAKGVFLCPSHVLKYNASLDEEQITDLLEKHT